MTDKAALRECPFCGGEAHVYKNNLWHVGCERAHNNCVTMSAFITEAEAIAAWNARADYHGFEQAAIEAWENIKSWNTRADLVSGTLTAEQVREAIEANSWPEQSMILEFSDSSWQAIADELNTRAERTCKFVSSKGSDYPPVCSACGYELGIYDCEWFEDGTYGYSGNYCQNCGAKVTKSDQDL